MNKRSLLPIILAGLIALSGCKKREEPALSISPPPKSSQDAIDNGKYENVNTVDPLEAQVSELQAHVYELNEKLNEAELEGTRLAIAKIGLQHDLEFKKYLQPFNEELDSIKNNIASLKLQNEKFEGLQELEKRINTINQISSDFLVHVSKYYEYINLLKKIGIEIWKNDLNEYELRRPFIFINSPFLQYKFYDQYYIPTLQIVSADNRLTAMRNVIRSNAQLEQLLGLHHRTDPFGRPDKSVLDFIFPPTETYYFYRPLKVSDGDYAIDLLGEAQDRVRTFISTFRSSLSDERRENEQQLLRFITKLTLNAMNIKSINIVENQRSITTISLINNQEIDNKIFMLVSQGSNFGEIVGIIEHNRSTFSQFQEKGLIKRLTPEEIEALNVKNTVLSVYQSKNVFYIQLK